jgi:putative spermidine/putrescine transport system permease protein
VQNKRKRTILILVLIFLPYASLLILSSGSGWSFPRLLPDRIDFAPWRTAWSGRYPLLMASLNTVVMSIVISLASTSLGLISGRALKRQESMLWLFVVYLPFVLSPVIVGTVLYDIESRLGIVSSILGVLIAQFMFAYAFATVFFYELWDSRIQRLEQLVQTLGGDSRTVWRHAILPSASGLIAVCLIQTSIFVWLDYGLVSALGGGNVPTVTLLLFSYLREASINQASQAAIFLLVGSVLACLTSAFIMKRTRRRLGGQL